MINSKSLTIATISTILFGVLSKMVSRNTLYVFEAF